jgi:hypothetical protein
MSDTRAYLVTIGTLPQRGRRRRRPVTAGRHRAGTASLRHCRELPAVDRRLPVRLPRSARGTAQPRALTILVVVLVCASAVSGWLAATGAAAFADMIAR